jgi:hypothetical protein
MENDDTSVYIREIYNKVFELIVNSHSTKDYKTFGDKFSRIIDILILPSSQS